MRLWNKALGPAALILSLSAASCTEQPAATNSNAGGAGAGGAAGSGAAGAAADWPASSEGPGTWMVRPHATLQRRRTNGIR